MNFPLNAVTFAYLSEMATRSGVLAPTSTTPYTVYQVHLDSENNATNPEIYCGSDTFPVS